jgi:hypothetical protein
MSFLHGQVADEPGISLKGYSGTSLGEQVWSGFELYSPAPNENVSDKIKNKYIPNIELLNKELHNIEVNLITNNNSDHFKQELLKARDRVKTRISELQKEMSKEFDDKDVQYFAINSFEERYRSNKNTIKMPIFLDGVPNSIVWEYEKTGDQNIIDNYHKNKEKEKMGFTEFSLRYFSKDQNFIKSIYDQAVSYDQQIEFIEKSRKTELENSIYKNKPEEITRLEVEEYIGRQLFNYEYPIRDTKYLLMYKYPTTSLDNLYLAPEPDQKNDSNWEHYRPILRKYYYNYQKYINDSFYFDDQRDPDGKELSNNKKINLKQDIIDGTNIEYELRAEFSKKNSLSVKYNNAVKWYLLDNPDITFNEYYNLFSQTEDYPSKDFLYAKDYIFTGQLTSFKEYKKKWVYRDFYYLNVEIVSSESESDSELDIESEADKLSNFLTGVYYSVTKPEFICGLVAGYICSRF